MKSLSNDSNNNNNWLGFSLSPHMNKMEGVSSSDHHPQTLSNSVPSFSHPPSAAVSPHHFNYPGIYYGMDGENAGFHSPLTVMPLKSDGSLCLMEAINRSQPQGLYFKLCFTFSSLTGFCFLCSGILKIFFSFFLLFYFFKLSRYGNFSKT